MEQRLKDQLGLLKAGVDKKLKGIKDIPTPKDLDKKFKTAKDESDKKVKEMSKTNRDVNKELQKEIANLKYQMEKVNVMAA